ncbi:hypothetical protein GGS23DRAFT_617302 [Durotheca rogersii]|uniref:uncharacterized protein n=1 Tax=Durotheca rogersii TaxID=419775 RepID=UPI00221E4B57|nr:uncharacterized protein GGS23DRAFT_617302 [Durotheca rogersii]KAI5866208.1 hypothetical protein GGS23DRAFT_617302 [Durotheca rogersii]
MAQLTTVKPFQFHAGEQAMHRLLHVPPQDNPTNFGLPAGHGYRISQSPLVAFGTLDQQGRPWATIWGGEAGFCRPIARNVLGVRATADARHDPVLRALFATPGAKNEDEIVIGDGDDAVVRPEGGGKLLAGLAIDLDTRDRVKIAGRMLVGTVARAGPGRDRGGDGVGDMQLAVKIEEALGNCPKYLNRKRITPRTPAPELASEGRGVPLPVAAVDLLARADMFFIASAAPGAGEGGSGSMDTNHRGGTPGFVRVLRNEEGGTALVYPEYSGNRLYQTLGNLHLDPRAGLAVPDLATGDVLYLTGRATVLAGAEAAACMPRAALAVRIDVAEARFVRDGLPFRGAALDDSPYNPAVWQLAGEAGPAPADRDRAVATAALVSRETLTPSISRYALRLEPGADRGEGGGRGASPTWLPGQHVTLDFSGELDCGWIHMRDEDPQSLNDDFVRTFTISCPPPADRDGDAEGSAPRVLEITARRHGAATRLLERWNLRVPLEIPVLGFGGAEGFRLPAGGDAGEADRTSVFVAGGVGITPLMAQAAGALRGGGERLRVLWSLRAEDLALAVAVVGATAGLAAVTRLFVTGGGEADARRDLEAAVRGLGAEVLARRMAVADVLAAGAKGRRKFYCCAGRELTEVLLQWTAGEDVACESFAY